MEDEDKNSKSLVLITRVGSTPTTGIKRQPRIERFWAVFLFLLSFLYFGVFWEDAESFSVVYPLTAWHIACKHRLPYENRCFFAVALSPGDYYTYKKGRVL